MKLWRRLGLWWLLLLFTAVVVTQPPPVTAHLGGYPHIINEPAGDFTVGVWSLPTPLIAGQDSNFIVALAQEDPLARAGLVVIDAAVSITLTPLAGGEAMVIYPSHETATIKIFYETYVQLPAVAGEWRADVQIDRNTESGFASFTFMVAEPTDSGFSWPLVGGVAVGLIGLLWLGWQARSRPATEEARPTAR